MDNLFRKGDAYAIPFIVKSGDTVIAPVNVSGVRIGFANLTASYPDGTLSFDGQYWLFPVEQNQSYGIPVGESEYQVQIQLSTGEILSSPRGKVRIDGTLFRQPWGRLELDDDASDASAVVAQIDPKPQSITAEIQQFSAGTGYVLPPATSDTLGGIKADPKQTEDVLPVHIGADEKAYIRVPNAGEVSYIGKIAEENVSTVKAALDTLAIGNYLDMSADYQAIGVAVEQWATMAKVVDGVESTTEYRVAPGRYCITLNDENNHKSYDVTIIDVPGKTGRVALVSYTDYDTYWNLEVYSVTVPSGDLEEQMYLSPEEGAITFYGGFNKLLPPADSSDNEKILAFTEDYPKWILPYYMDMHGYEYSGIEDALYAIAADIGELSQRVPKVYSKDNGKFLQVVNGKWVASNLPTYDGGVS